ncbi:FG-GAP repeat protein [Rudanella lutea]|uniref:FG-GAP repeat protein n=1 Tax=Rudanella lutea TaxID=451374 RepID=UPI000362DE49|nr:FG-GAP repeat protein [Rudanella lutea]
MTYLYSCLTGLLLCLALSARAQIGMGGQPHSSAVLDLKSPANDKAFYPPRLTTAQRLAITNPQIGALVFDLDKGTLYLHDGQNWLPLATTSNNNLAPIDRLASDGAKGDVFGVRVMLSGDYAIVGASGADIGSNVNQGAAYIFVRSGSTWIQQAKLTANDGAAGDVFGVSVAIAGDYAIVGARSDDIGANIDQGSVYVFVRSGTTWTQQAKLTAGDGTTDDKFGHAVAISGDYVLVSAPSDDIEANADAGSAYIFIRSGATWTQQAKLTASDGAANDQFGSSAAISGDYAIVGANFDDINANTDQGSAYVFVRSGTTWTQQVKLTAGDGDLADNFGYSVAISGDYAVIGAYTDDINSNRDQGSAYVFVRSGGSWAQQAKLTAVTGGAVSDLFGGSVGISGDYALIGAFGMNTYQGSAYLFVRSGTSWNQVRKIVDNTSALTFNGYSVSISNGVFIIGAYGFQNNQSKVGFGTID